jgi:hypothetical protein
MAKVKIAVTETRTRWFRIDGLSESEIYDLDNDEHTESQFIEDVKKGIYDSNETGVSKHTEISWFEKLEKEGK